MVFFCAIVIAENGNEMRDKLPFPQSNLIVPGSSGKCGRSIEPFALRYWRVNKTEGTSNCMSGMGLISPMHAPCMHAPVVHD